MTPVWLRFRSELRTRWRSWLTLAVLVAVSTGVVLTAVAGARRADSAYDRLVATSNSHDVIVFGQPFDVDLAAVADLPEVADAVPVAYVLLAEPERGEELTITPLVSVDGGFFGRISRPKVLEGRRPDPNRPDEVAISPPLARTRNLGVGSTIKVKGFTPEQVPQIFEGNFSSPAGPDVTLRVVGIELIAAEGELVGSTTSEDNLHLTPAFARAYGETIGMTPLLAVKLERGAADLASFRSAVERIGGGQPVQMNSQAEEGSKPRRSIHLQAVALAVFAGLAALTAVLALGQALARQASASADDNPTLSALGMTSRQLWAAAMLRSATIGLVGAAAAVTVAVLASPLMPLGLARLAEPSPGISVDGLVLGLGLLAVPVLVLAATALPAWRAAHVATSRRDDVPATRHTPVADRLAAAGLPPSAVAGVRLAVDPGRGPTAAPIRSAIVGIALALAATTTVVMFGASLDNLFSTPRLYGWDWDFTVGNPYVSDIADEAIPALEQSRAVGGFSAVAVTDLDIAGDRTQALGVQEIRGSVVPPIVEGRAPRQPDEVALGANTMVAAGRSLGQTMDIRVGDTVSTVRVVGEAVFPSLGQFDVKRPGDGALFTIDGLRRLVPGAARNVFPIRVAAGADREETLAALNQELNHIGSGLPVPPADLADFGQVDDMPAVLTGLLALMATAIMGHALVTTVRRRRRELAILKTLGFVRGQVRATVAWQATTMTGLALVVGVPLGIVVGRFGWHLFAEELGIVPAPVVPVLLLVLAAVVTLLLGNLVAAFPGSAAAHARPAEGLRAE